MDLTCLKISAPINNECDTQLVNDFYRIATIFPYDEVDEDSIVVDGCSVKFDLKAKGGGVLVKDPSNMPFNGTGTTSEDKSRLVYNQSVMLPIIEKTPENAKILDDLVNSFKRVVVILKHTNYNADGTNAYVVYGHETGLYVKEKKGDAENLAAYHLTLASNIVGKPDFFFFDTDLATTVAKVDSFSSHEVIYLNIASGETTPRKVYLKVDTDKTAYIKLPNGTLLTTTSGVIDTTYEGYAGVIRLTIPKTTVLLQLTDNVGGSYFSGSFVTSIALSSLIIAGCQFTSVSAVNLLSTLSIAVQEDLTSFYAPKAININAFGCALTAKSIGDWLFAAKKNNPTEHGSADFIGPDNAQDYLVAVYMFGSGADEETLVTWIGDNLPNYTIDFN